MPDSLIKRLDSFVIGLLDEAEGSCGEPPENVTKTSSEDNPGSQSDGVVTFDQRTSLLKACTAYLNIRAGKATGEEAEEPAEIDAMVNRLRPNHRKARR